jgi:hypothetical protein
MVTTTRRAWTLRVIAVLIAAAVAGSAAWWLAGRNHASRSPDCAVVRAMIDYSSARGQQFGAAFIPAAGAEPSISDYQDWADHLREYASAIHQPELAAHANRLADQARQMVALVAQAHSDKTVPADPQAPPPWAPAYSELTQQTHTELAALNNACPAH